jgi:predicted RNA binding protein YcfA (HicA-like mRNA interferase family)
MPRLGVFSGDELCRLLETSGFRRVRQRGSHVVMQKADGRMTTTVPVPLHREICAGTLRSIIRQSGLSKSLFER